NEVGADQISRLKSVGVSFKILSPVRGPIGLLMAAMTLGKICRFWKPDIIHSHTDLPDFAVALLRIFKHFRTARTIHNTEVWPGRKWLAASIEQAFVEDLVIAVSTAAMESYIKLRCKAKLEKGAICKVIYNGANENLGNRKAIRLRLARNYNFDAN